MAMKTITILGATGSIGKNTLALIAEHPERYRVFALTGHHQLDLLASQCRQFNPRFAVLADETSAKTLQAQLKDDCQTEVLFGEQALVDVASAAEVDMVMAAIVGIAGLKPTWAAMQKGKRILLANKETLVVAGALFMAEAVRCGACILPVDSEHNAIFQSLPVDYSHGLKNKGIESIILTASGGPLLNVPEKDFATVTPEQAVAHPNWSMGRKISVDSASMMNKGLEVIEAHWLFAASSDQIEVIIHPQSVIHSMVRYIDGSVLAQLGTPDMKTPIAYCMAYPERIKSHVKRLDFTALNGLTFAKPDLTKFRCLQLAFDALQMGADAPCILNAANEVAVAAFLDKKINFTHIAQLVDAALSHIDIRASLSIEGLFEKDQQTRSYVCQLIKEKNYAQ